MAILLPSPKPPSRQAGPHFWNVFVAAARTAHRPGVLDPRQIGQVGDSRRFRAARLCYKRVMSKAQTVIVTGASSGIGRATTLKFAASGAAVFAVGRQEAALQEVVGEAIAAGGRAGHFVADITAPEVPDRI